LINLPHIGGRTGITKNKGWKLLAGRDETVVFLAKFWWGRTFLFLEAARDSAFFRSPGQCCSSYLEAKRHVAFPLLGLSDTRSGFTGTRGVHGVMVTLRGPSVMEPCCSL
ncbi:unnamed protein product, partial [Pylaiella littoralis]